MNESLKSTRFRVPDRTIEVLEWKGVQRLLGDCARTPQGKTFCALLKPGALSRGEAEAIAEATLEWRELSSELKILMPLADIPDLGTSLKRISRSASISIGEFASLIRFHRAAQGLSQFLNRYTLRKPALQQALSGLELLESWARKQFPLLDAQGQMADNASEDLRALRGLVKELHEQIKKRLDDYLHNPKLAELMQDFYITIRDGRYVIPVKVNFKGRVPGIVHDVSNTEQTLFVEPQEIVEWNNQLKVAEKEIEKEIDRILAVVVAETRPVVEALQKNEELIARADFISANARFSESFGLSYSKAKWHKGPVIAEGLLHPLLVQGRPVVANSLNFEQALILSGPNTGGKTVLLKALGLAALMAQCGCLVPAKSLSLPESLSGLRANIGDEQSLDLNLSTFSGHLQFLNEILNEAEAGDLVLIDEIATGTSPEEGQPLAQAIIERLLDNKVLLFVTTHYGGLKQFAMIEDRCRIAAMTFDKQSQSPTFKMEMDVPGESSAFDVALQLGLPRAVIDRARALRGEVSVDLNCAIEKLEQARKDFVHRGVELEAAIEKARLREQTAQAKIMELEAKMREGVQTEAREAIKKFNILRDELAALIRGSDPATLAQGAQGLFNKIADAQDQARGAIEGNGVFDPGSKLADEKDLNPDTIVEVEGFGMGFVVERPSEMRGPKTQVKVKVGDLHLTALLSRLRVPASARAHQFKASRMAASTSRERRLQDKSTSSRGQGGGSLVCDIRGKAVEEGLRKVEVMLNELAVNEDAVLTVIHGHGTDRLKDALRTYIEKERPELKYRSGSWPGEGGDGVTVIERGN